MTKLEDKKFVSDDEEPLLPDESKDTGKLFKNKSEFLTVVAMAVAYLYGGMTFSALGPFFSPAARKKGVNGTIIGLIFAVQPVVIFLLAPIVSKVVLYLGIRPCIVIGTFLECVSQILYGTIGDMYAGTTFIVISFVCRIGTAVGVTFCEVAFLSLICITFKENLGLIFGINEIFTGIGLTLGPVVGGFLFQAGGFKLPFIFLGCTVLIDILLVLFILPPKDAEKTEESEEVKILDVLRIPKVLLQCIVLIIMLANITFLDPTLADYLNKITWPEGMTSDKAGLVFLIHAFFYAASAPFIGMLIDRRVSYVVLEVFGFSLSICGLLLIGPAPFFQSFLKPKVYLVCISLVFLGVGAGFVAVPILPVMCDGAVAAGLPNNLKCISIVSGLFTSALNIGYAFGPALGGALADDLSFPWTAFVWACLTLAAILLVLVFDFYEKKKEKRAAEVRDLLSTKIANKVFEMK